MSTNSGHSVFISDYADQVVGGVLGAGADDTPAFVAAQAALPSTGGDIVLDAGYLYLVNWTVTKDNVHLAGQYGAGDGNVTIGLAPYDTTAATLTVGSGSAQLRSFSATQLRIYSKTASKGLLINGAAYVRFIDCEFGGFVDYSVWITSPGGAGSYYIHFIGCTFFSSSNTTGDVIVLTYGSSFVTAVFLTGCNVDSSNGGNGCHAMRIGDQVEVFPSQTWFEVADGKGIKVEGTGRFHGDNVMVDSPLPTDVLIEWPSAEIYPNTYFTGEIRVDGVGKNSTPATFDLRGVFNTARGFTYGQTSYRSRFIGDLEQINEVAAALSGPLMRVAGGGPPLADASYTAGSLFRSTNNSGNSNTLFVKSLDKDFARVVTGDYLGQTSDSNIPSAATTDIGAANGDFVFVTGTVTITSFGSSAPRNGVKRRVFFTENLTITHNATSLYLPGGINYNTIGGDVGEFVYMGSGNWRCIGFTNVYGLPQRAARRTLVTKTASFSFQFNDDLYFFRCDHASTPIVATIPQSVFDYGVELVIEQYGAAAASFVAGSGVTVNKLTGKTLVAAGQHGVIRCYNNGSNIWTAYGDLGT